MPIDRIASMDLRRRAKRLAERALLLSGVPRLARWRRGGDILVLAYHDIIPHGQSPAGDRSLHLPQRAFAEQLDHLQATCDVVTLDDALSRGAMRSSRASVVITFDDAYRGAVTAGVDELSARGLPATIFVPPAFLDGGIFWWDALTPAGASGPPAVLRARALADMAGKGQLILSCMARETSTPTAPAYARGASELELRRAVEQPGITLGSHSWSHPNLPALAAGELAEELERPLAWLLERFDNVLPYLSFPYGLSSSAVEDAARTAGYHAALRIDGGWLSRRPGDRYGVPRLDVPSGLSLEGFRLRSAGLLS